MSDYLPQEVLIKILARLPPVSLIKFRCVSKSWNLLIASPFFISMQIEQAILSKPVDAGTEQIIVRRYSKAQNSEVYSVHIDNEEFPDDKNIKIEYPFRDSTRFYYRIVGSCNGVLCLSDDLFGQADSTLLWNPVIKRKVTLPVPQATFDTMGLTCLCSGSGLMSKIMTTSLELAEFSGEVPVNCVVEYFWSEVLISGKVHWVAYRNMGMQEKVENLIMVFNLSSEVFDEMQLPSALENELPINLNAAVLAQSLAVVQYDERVWSKSCCIWVMENYGDGESWSKQYNIEVDGGLGMILGFRANGDVLLTARNRGLVSCNPVTGQGRDLGISGTKDSFYVGTYVESLSLLVEGKEARERIPSDTETESESESECESSVDDDEDRYGDVEKSEFWMQSSMCQYLTVLLKRTFM
ncbi:UNVERIFIED_CONTAM: F-box protein [Sesamum radiatum]|uniref:F-box protein n=1 Tax=Sesamum radiatum TaxID=300843 RepID=A0AAW2K6A7_SESRA